jgi:hypothetical protein
VIERILLSNMELQNVQIAPEIIQAIIAQATARGLSVDDYLRQALGVMNRTPSPDSQALAVTVQLGARNMAGCAWTVAPNQTMLCDDVARPQYHKARLGTHSSGGAHSFAVASAARAVTADSLRRV